MFSREGLAIEVGQRLKAEHVVEVLNRLVRQRGAPSLLFADNGSEFTGHLVDLWAYRCKVRIDFSRPGKPTDNAFIETFNGSLRDECLNLHWFETMAEARSVIEAWRRDYQREPASHGPWSQDAGGIPFADGRFTPGERARRRRRLTLDPDHQPQALQAGHALTFSPDHSMGAGHFSDMLAIEHAPYLARARFAHDPSQPHYFVD